MRKSLTALVCLIVFGFAVKNYAGAPSGDSAAAKEAAAAAPLSDATALTIYNRDFAVVRQGLTLDLHPGMNRVSFPDATLSLEPDSVILRDLSHRPLQVLEQNYRNDPVSQELLLSMFEGKTIDFVRYRGNTGDKEVIQERSFARDSCRTAARSSRSSRSTASSSSSCLASRSSLPSATTPSSSPRCTG